MNLALADIHHHFVRFLVTAIGIGALLTASIGMIGLYRGIVFEALLIINDVGADLWVVEGNRVGPFAERSEVSSMLDRRLEGVPGVSEVRQFIQYNQQYLIDGRRLQVAVTALDFPKDTGSWIPLIAGRHLYAGHYEAIADRSLGLQVGQQIRLGHDDYTIVGVAIGQVDIGGDGMLFVTIPDAQSLDSFVPSEAVLLRQLQHTVPNPNLLGYAVGNVAALMVTLSPGANSGQVQSRVRQWGDVTVLTRKDEEDVLVNGRLRRTQDTDTSLCRNDVARNNDSYRPFYLYDDNREDAGDCIVKANRRPRPLDRRNDSTAGAIYWSKLIRGSIANGAFHISIFPTHRSDSMARCCFSSVTGTHHVRRWKLVWNKEGHERSRAGSIVVSAETLISVSEATKTYPMGKSTVYALRNVSISINSGELLGIFGPSGAGKTTLLMIAGLLDTPSSGAVLFKHQVISAPGVELNDLRLFRRQHIGFVFQKPNLIPFLTAIGNVKIALLINDEDKKTATDRAQFLLEKFGIGDRADNLPVELSGGEQQRVAIARALANRPELIFADEPTANLDSSRGRQVMETFRQLADYERVSVCVVTHDTRSNDLFDRRIELCDGTIVNQ